MVREKITTEYYLECSKCGAVPSVRDEDKHHLISMARAYGWEIPDDEGITCYCPKCAKEKESKKDGFDKIWEVCPHCENEVELKPEMVIQKCPKCGEWICPCSMCDCDQAQCCNCELEKECKRRNNK